jgi:hypothetical protein
MSDWTKDVDKLMKDANDCYEKYKEKPCNKCRNIDDCKRGTPLEKFKIE